MTDPRMTPTNDAPVTVEQCDREAAARERTAEYEGYGFKAESLETPTEIRRGHRDWDPLVQKHARRRLAALASAPAAGSREAAMVTLRTDDSGRPKVWCDPEIADLIDALNTDALSTVASCSGHGHRPGIIMLADGRCLMVFRDREYAKAAEAAYPLDINGIASAPAKDADTPSTAEVAEAILARPRAAVGEQSREAVREAVAKGLAAFIADEPDYDMSKRMIRTATEYIMAEPGIFALQAPPAKVEG